MTAPARARSTVRRWLRRAWVVVALIACGLAFLVADGWTAFGARARAARRARMEVSPAWHDGHFVNPQPLRNVFWKAVSGAMHRSPDVSPSQPPRLAEPAGSGLEVPPRTGLRATWLGHSTTLVEIDGRRFLIDPVWSDRASPFPWIGPRRFYSPPIALADLPPLDAVLISHDHYDHLDRATVVALGARSVTFIVPLGVGAHLGAWGIPEARIIELDWWQRTRVGSVEIVSTPARHASGRMLIDNDTKLWTGYALVGPAHRVYYSGDSGLFPALRDIGTRLGPFDLTMIEVGQYGQAWPDWHMGPEQAVAAHQMVRGRLMLPVHWGAFALAYHAWTEPIERALAAAAGAGAHLVAPRPGQSFEPAVPAPLERWWPTLPTHTAAQDPIVSSQMR